MEMSVNKKIDTPVQSFDSAWWDRFLEHTGHMAEPDVFKGAIDADMTARMRRYVLDIIAELGEKRKESYGYRLWLDGELVTDLNPHFDQSPLPHETIEQWVARTFGERKFGIILNKGEKFSMGLSKSIALMLQPLLEKIGMPTEGFIFTIFIGNYDMTPLGIHQDAPGKSVMHFHLGPGSKSMYTWMDEDYVTEDSCRKQGNQNVEPHLASATKHTFDEGDIYFMPENRFHLGTQDGLSIGIACWCNNKSNHGFARQLLTLIERRSLKACELMLKSDKNAVGDISSLETTLDLFDLSEFEGLDMKELMRSVYKDVRYGMFSNAGYRNAPLPNLNAVVIDAGSRFRIEQPYKIMHHVTPEGDKIVLYVRGTRIEMHNYACIVSLVEILNAGEELSYARVREILDLDWPITSVNYLLGLLHKHRGMEIL